MVFTKSTRKNPQGVTTPAETKEAKLQELEKAKEIQELVNEEHCNAQDHDLTNEESTSEDLLDIDGKISVLQKVIKVINNLL